MKWIEGLNIDVKHQRWLVPVTGMILVVVFYFPYLWLGENSLYQIGDSLDSVVPWYTVLAKSSNFFSFDPKATIDGILISLPRNAFPNPLKIESLIFYVFRPSIAIIINLILNSLVGFLGLFYFLKNLRVFGENLWDNVILLLLCFGFSISCSNPLYGGGWISTIPWFFLAFHRLIRNEKVVGSLIILLILPLYSSLVMSLLFCLGFSVLLYGYQLIKVRSVSWPVLIGVIVFGFSTIITDLNLFLLVFSKTGFVSQRVIRPFDMMSFGACLGASWNLFWQEKIVHQQAMHHFIVMVSLVVFIVMSFRKAIVPFKQFLFFFLIVIGVSLIGGFAKSQWVEKLGEIIPLLNALEIDRIIVVKTFIWWTLFALAIAYIRAFRSVFIGPVCVILCLGSIFYAVKNNWSYRANLEGMLGKRPSVYWNTTTSSMKDYYASSLFRRVKSLTDSLADNPNYNVGCIGLHPGVPEYNGLRTIDGYYVNYSLAYHTQFRRIIARELAKDPVLAAKYDLWGNRCYLFVADIYKDWDYKNKIISKKSVLATHVDFDFSEIKKLDCEFLISTVELLNGEVELKQTFTQIDSPYKIYVYQVL